MHFLLTVAVLVYTPTSGGATARRVEAQAALQAAGRAAGALVIDRAVERAEVAIVEGWVGEEELAFFGRGAQLIADGRRALGHVELERGEALLAEAERVYAPELWRPGVASEAATAALWRGVALFELGRKDEARRAWRRAVALEPAAQLTEAMVRPEVVRAFAAATAPSASASASGAARSGDEVAHVERPADGAAAAVRGLAEAPTAAGVEALRVALGADEVIVAAVSVDAGALTYAATRRGHGCGSATIVGTRPAELWRRLAEAPCTTGAPIAVLLASEIAQPRPAPELALGKRGLDGQRKSAVWRQPWLWVTVVGAVGVGVVLAVSLWPRDATYSVGLDFHQFALGR